jgi:hypothetical protein
VISDYIDLDALWKIVLVVVGASAGAAFAYSVAIIGWGREETRGRADATSLALVIGGLVVCVGLVVLGLLTLIDK